MLRVESKLEPELEAVVTEVLDAGYTVYRELGPGFRELIYERAYCLELSKRGIPFEAEKPIRVRYKEWEIPGQKVDLIVRESVLVEIKAVPRLREIHRAQTLSYLKTLNLRVALVMKLWWCEVQRKCEAGRPLTNTYSLRALRVFVLSCVPKAPEAVGPFSWLDSAGVLDLPPDILHLFERRVVNRPA